MKASMMDIICCPVCKGDLELRADRTDDAGDIIEGVLICKACNVEYPISEGIPDLLPRNEE